MPASTSRQSAPAAMTRSRKRAYSWPLVSNVPTRTTVGMRRLVAQRDVLEVPDRLPDRPLDRQALHGRGADEPLRGRVGEDHANLGGGCDRAAVREHDHVRLLRA